MKSKQALCIFLFGIPFVFALVIWVPIVQKYHVRAPVISDPLVSESRNYPSSISAQKIENFEMEFLTLDVDDRQLILAAENLLNGVVDLPGYSRMDFQYPFDASMVQSEDMGWRFAYSLFIVPKILLEAYDLSGQDEFLLAARDFILGWHKYEKKLLSPVGFIWNDHAFASRAQVLSDFWFRYKNHPAFDNSQARVVLRMACRIAGFLARDHLYTFRTNHGKMQNLALLKLSAYFPRLPKMSDHQQKAFDRIREQMLLFVNDEGMVVEHSFGYHRFGIDLMKSILGFYSLTGGPAPDEIVRRYHKARDLLKQFSRPDGTLAAVGDTTIRSRTADKRMNAGFLEAPNSETILLKSGYAVWWTGLKNWPDAQGLFQAVVTWSYYPYMGHKHADELSVQVWGAGYNWLTSVGYWPYADPRRDLAVLWSGSNAPHLLNESGTSERISQLLFSGKGDGVRFLDLERANRDGFGVRRQIINLDPDQWIVVDSFSDNVSRQVRTVWTFGEGLEEAQQISQNTYQIKAKDSAWWMRMEFLTPEQISISQVFGLNNPLMGWIATDFGVKPAPALITIQPSRDHWCATLIRVEEGQIQKNFSGSAKMVQWSGPQNWELVLSDGGKMQRRDGALTVSTSGGESRQVHLEQIPLRSQSHDASDDVFKALDKKYGKERIVDAVNFRKKASLLGVMYFLFYIAGSMLVGKYMARYRFLFQCFILVGWLLIFGYYVYKLSVISMISLNI